MNKKIKPLLVSIAVILPLALGYVVFDLIAGGSTEYYDDSYPKETQNIAEDIKVGFVKKVPWAESGHWYSIDTHMHTKFSDGGHTMSELAEHAIKNQCDAIAVTDHGDNNLPAGSLDYYLEVNAMNELHDDLTIISGIEWNVPPYKGREHVTVLFPEMDGSAFLAEKFGEKFDQTEGFNAGLSSANSALKWLESKFKTAPVLPVVIFNHPSRKAIEVNQRYADMAGWRDLNDIAVGFSGAPGHQKLSGKRNGSYRYRYKTEDRWDPVVAEVGGVWDQLLRDGYDVWGGRAPSDFHGPGMDYWPCEFAETKIYAKDASVNSILAAFREGMFFGVHGKFVKTLDFTVSADGLSRPAQMGETIALPKGSDFQINLEVDLNAWDWQGSVTTIDEVELITINGQNISSQVFDAKSYLIGDKLLLKQKIRLGSEPIVIRWRGRSKQPEEHDYMFYSNPIRVLVANSI